MPVASALVNRRGRLAMAAVERGDRQPEPVMLLGWLRRSTRSRPKLVRGDSDHDERHDPKRPHADATDENGMLLDPVDGT
jgi:hypothetical protein